MPKPFDMSLVQRGARLRRSPFYEATQRRGPKGFTVYNHTLFPTNYDDFVPHPFVDPEKQIPKT
jgi:hypothetical protein